MMLSSSVEPVVTKMVSLRFCSTMDAVVKPMGTMVHAALCILSTLASDSPLSLTRSRFAACATPSTV
jgi:hypothetical protein